jgi:hypothetical protein
MDKSIKSILGWVKGNITEDTIFVPDFLDFLSEEFEIEYSRLESMITSENNNGEDDEE